MGWIAIDKSLKYADDCHTKFGTCAFIKYYRYLLFRRRNVGSADSTDRQSFSRFLTFRQIQGEIVNDRSFQAILVCPSLTKRSHFQLLPAPISYRYKLTLVTAIAIITTIISYRHRFLMRAYRRSASEVTVSIASRLFSRNCVRAILTRLRIVEYAGWKKLTDRSIKCTGWTREESSRGSDSADSKTRLVETRRRTCD